MDNQTNDILVNENRVSKCIFSEIINPNTKQISLEIKKKMNTHHFHLIK